MVAQVVHRFQCDVHLNPSGYSNVSLDYKLTVADGGAFGNGCLPAL